jgi:hypothetical protein
MALEVIKGRSAERLKGSPCLPSSSSSSSSFIMAASTNNDN